MITSGSEITLGWVSHEINLCLVQSKQYLEAYQEHGDRNDLEECRKQIHQLRNTLIVINLYGASMLAEELEAVVHFLQEQTDGSSERSVLEAISTGIVSLQDYLERVEKGAPDVPVILLPVLNELRASRQKHLLSESAFFSPKLKEFLAIELAEPYEENGELKNFISENRTSFHRSLLKWYQDSDASSGLSTIREILNGAALRASKPVSRLFSLGSELAYLIWSHPSESSMATKLVVGQLDAIFRKILATGEEGLRQDFPVERLRNLLFYIGRSKTDSPDISKLKEEYSLETEIVYGALSGKSAEMP